VGYNLRALKLTASSVRERLSQEHWSVITRAEAEFTQRCAAHAAQGDWSASRAPCACLDTASGHMAAITGAQTDRMTRDDGWRLLSIGRLIERLCVLAPALASGFQTGAVHDSGGFEALVALFDSTITFHAQYQQSREVAALVDLLVLDRDNPRSLGWVAQTLRGRLAKLAGSAPDALDPLAQQMPDPAQWSPRQAVRARTPGALPGAGAIVAAHAWAPPGSCRKPSACAISPTPSRPARAWAPDGPAHHPRNALRLQRRRWRPRSTWRTCSRWTRAVPALLPTSSTSFRRPPSAAVRLTCTAISARSSRCSRRTPRCAWWRPATSARAARAADSRLAWEAVRERLRFHAGAAWDAAAEFVFASHHVPRHEQFAAYARPSFAPGRRLIDAARDLMARIHTDFTYESRSAPRSTPRRWTRWPSARACARTSPTS
jgi:hypothetical protein